MCSSEDPAQSKNKINKSDKTKILALDAKESESESHSVVSNSL